MTYFYILAGAIAVIFIFTFFCRAFVERMLAASLAKFPAEYAKVLEWHRVAPYKKAPTYFCPDNFFYAEQFFDYARKYQDRGMLFNAGVNLSRAYRSLENERKMLRESEVEHATKEIIAAVVGPEEE